LYGVVQALLAFITFTVPEGEELPNLFYGKSDVQMSTCQFFYVLVFTFSSQQGPDMFASILAHAAKQAKEHNSDVFTQWTGLGHAVRS
jgi:hypothetical protein